MRQKIFPLLVFILIFTLFIFQLPTFTMSLRPKHNFLFRENLIFSYNYIRNYLFKSSSSSEVVFGKEGWHFYSDFESVRSGRHQQPFNPSELEKIHFESQAFYQKMKAENICYLFVVIPNPSNIYSEFAPEWLNHHEHPLSRLEQLDNTLNPDYFLDLKSSLLAKKNVGRLYKKTDSHWNQLGAYFGYAAIFEHIRTKCADQIKDTNFMPVPIGNFEIFKSVVPGGDLASILTASSYTPEEDIALIPPGSSFPVKEDLNPVRWITENTSIQNQLTMLVFNDSYADALRPFFSQHFVRVNYFWQPFLDLDKIELLHPKIVLHEMIERKLEGTDSTFY